MQDKIEQAKAEFLSAQEKLRKKDPRFARAFESQEQAIRRGQNAGAEVQQRQRGEGSPVITLSHGDDFEVEDKRPTPEQKKRQLHAMRGMGRIYRRGGVYWVEYWHQGKQYRESSGSTKEAKARNLLKDRLDKIGADRQGLKPFIGPAQQRVTVEDLLKSVERDYQIHGRKSFPQLRAHLRDVRAFFGLDRALAVTPERLRDYIAHRQEEDAAPATINRELEGLQRGFALAVEAGRLSTAPKFPSLPEYNARQGFCEKGEFEAIMGDLADADLTDFCEWFFYTGMRPGGIRSLPWPAFDRETWTLRLHAKDDKTRKGLVLALEGPLRAIIERRLKARRLDCPLIFHRNGQPIGDFRKRWVSACKKAGLEGKLLYDLRRTAVRNMVRAGVPERVAMAISGHRTRSVFDRYNIVSEDDLREAMAKTSAYVASLPMDRKVVPFPKAQEASGGD